VDDLSTWYLRRSRERMKEEDIGAKQTLYYVLKNLAKILAPFAPFVAEEIWLKLKNEEDTESVHLASWPKIKKRLGFFAFLKFGLGKKEKVIDKMKTVRSIVTLGLEARQKVGIKVRQPLNLLKIVAEGLSDEYIEIIKSELNVKNVDFILKIKLGITKVTLDTEITPELKQEGDYRELLRSLQDMRKNQGLTPSDIVTLSVETSDAGKKLIRKFENEIKKTVLVSEIRFENNSGDEIKIDELLFKVKMV
ncbi:MAG: Isoleucine-tRNA ligase, partial [Candidatus Nomurabacteria bacterium GW2011_GWF2_43_8]